MKFWFGFGTIFEYRAISGFLYEPSGLKIRSRGMMLFGNGSRIMRARVRRIGPRRQRIVDLVLRRVGQSEQVGEIALQVLRRWPGP